MTNEQFIFDLIEKETYFREHRNAETFMQITDEIIHKNLWNAVPLIFGDEPLYNDEHWCQKAYIKCKDIVPDESKWSFMCACYVKDGYDFPKGYIYEVLPYRPKNYLDKLPDGYEGRTDKDVITVYRASQTNPIQMFGVLVYEEKIKSELSWTLSPNIALGVYQMRESNRQNCYFYQADINKKDIIAYVSEEQQEIIQENGVYNIKEMCPYRFSNLCKLEKECGLDVAQVIDRMDYLCGARYTNLGKYYKKHDINNINLWS